MSNQQQGFFVYIVESPSAPDLYHRRSEGEVLSRALELSGIICVSRCAISREAFQAALQIGLQQEMAQLNQLIPIVHISSHGHADGIQLSSGEIINWDMLSKLLAPINDAFAKRLVVAMSCCEGYCGIRMAMKLDNSPLPFFALVGSSGKPTWSDTAVAFSAFYHRLTKGAHISEAVEAMKVASGCDHFYVEWADQSKKGYLEYLKTLNSSQVQHQLNALANAQPAQQLAKLVTLEGKAEPRHGS